MKYTNQEAFDKVVKHLVRQGIPATGCCTYHSEDNLKCAAGCLVERKDLRVKLEGDWDEAISAYPNLANLASPKLVNALQEAHDVLSHGTISVWRENWNFSMKELAKTFKLETTLLDKLVTKEWLDELI